jgi:hypothetical protein
MPDFEAVPKRGLSGNGQVQDSIFIHAGHAVFRFQKGVGL